MVFSVKQTIEFDKWFNKQSLKIQALVSDRIGRLTVSGYMGKSRTLGMGLFELKWKNGLRIYFAFSEKKLVLLNGGSKNGQKKDIERARELKEKYLKAEGV